MIPWWAIVLFVAFDLFVCVAVIWGMVHACWRDIAKNFPAQAPSQDGVERRFQSFKFGICNFGACVHVVADEKYLHLTPVRWVQRLGAKPMSVPWSSMEIVKRGTKWSKVRLQGQTVGGPAWCLNLASPEADG
jgi:hypothetical protein